MKKKESRVIIPEKLYQEFKRKCEFNYKTMSEVVRDFMLKYIEKK